MKNLHPYETRAMHAAAAIRTDLDAAFVQQPPPMRMEGKRKRVLFKSDAALAAFVPFMKVRTSACMCPGAPRCHAMCLWDRPLISVLWTMVRLRSI